MTLYESYLLSEILKLEWSSEMDIELMWSLDDIEKMLSR